MAYEYEDDRVVTGGRGRIVDSPVAAMDSMRVPSQELASSVALRPVNHIPVIDLLAPRQTEMQRRQLYREQAAPYELGESNKRVRGHPALLYYIQDHNHGTRRNTPSRGPPRHRT